MNQILIVVETSFPLFSILGLLLFFLFVLVSDAVKKETLISGVAQLPFFATVRDFDKSIEKCFLQELQCTFVLCVKALVISWSF